MSSNHLARDLFVIGDCNNKLMNQLMQKPCVRCDPLLEEKSGRTRIRTDPSPRTASFESWVFGFLGDSNLEEDETTTIMVVTKTVPKHRSFPSLPFTSLPMDLPETFKSADREVNASRRVIMRHASFLIRLIDMEC